ncbi:SOSS complex subunit B-like [Papilio machaon]|uniref:SOSS complex subunit B-like n=1 Tax=Papilio machaon TaxID=76193 RepID=A0A0N0PCR7_PAPMA|nr:SOSS complex subunit B-like [Papilio machaon]
MSSTTEFVQIKDLKPGMKNINAVFIVLEVGPPTLTKEAREVRTLRVADASAMVNFSVWDEPGALLQPGDIVRLTRGYASLWRSALTLYSGKSGDIQKVGEFCMIFNEQVNMSEPQPAAPVGASTAQPANERNGNGNGTHSGPRSLMPNAAASGQGAQHNNQKQDRYSGAPQEHPGKHPHKTYRALNIAWGSGVCRQWPQQDEARRRIARDRSRPYTAAGPPEEEGREDVLCNKLRRKNMPYCSGKSRARSMYSVGCGAQRKPSPEALRGAGGGDGERRREAGRASGWYMASGARAATVLVLTTARDAAPRPTRVLLAGALPGRRRFKVKRNRCRAAEGVALRNWRALYCRGRAEIETSEMLCSQQHRTGLVLTSSAGPAPPAPSAQPLVRLPRSTSNSWLQLVAGHNNFIHN